MRPIALALLFAAVAAPSFAQDAQFANPTPIDFSKPFLVDGNRFSRPVAQDEALPVEVIGRAELQRNGAPTMDELVRSLSEIGKVQSQSVRSFGEPGACSVVRQGELVVKPVWSSCGDLRDLANYQEPILRKNGSGRTLVTFNGRRLADEPPAAAGAPKANDAVSMEEMERALSDIGMVKTTAARGGKASGIGISTINLRSFNSVFDQKPERMAPRSNGLVHIDDESSTDGTRP